MKLNFLNLILSQFVAIISSKKIDEEVLIKAVRIQFNQEIKSINSLVQQVKPYKYIFNNFFILI